MRKKQQGITIKDVARKAGVSTATVSRVMNDDDRVSEATKEHVRRYLRETGYRANAIARSLRSKRSHTIGILAPEFQNDFFMAVAEGIEQVLRTRGLTTFIVNSREKTAEEKARIELLIEKQADGAIVIPASCRGEHFEPLREHGIPFVLVDRLVEGLAEDCVLTDNFSGAYAAVEACLLDGAETVAVIGGPDELTSAKERREGYEAAMLFYGKEIRRELVFTGDMHRQSGYEAMQLIMKQFPDISHVFIINLFMRIGAEQFLAEHAVDAGRLKIASFDYSPISSLFRHSFITVKQPLEEIGTAAAGLLLKRIDKVEMPFPQVRRLAPEIIRHAE